MTYLTQLRGVGGILILSKNEKWFGQVKFWVAKNRESKNLLIIALSRLWVVICLSIEHKKAELSLRRIMDQERVLEDPLDEELLEAVQELIVQQTDANTNRDNMRELAYIERVERWEEIQGDRYLENPLLLPTDMIWTAIRLIQDIRDERAFKSHIGVSPQVVALIWLRYEADFEERGFTQLDLLLGLHWLTTNCTMDQLGTFWHLPRSSADSTLKKALVILWDVLDEINWQKLHWHKDEYLAPPGNLFNGVTFCLDGIECGITKPIDRTDEIAWYSDKKGQHSVKYETCTHISSGRIMWVAGGIPGSIHDITLTYVSGLMNHVPAGEKGLVDSGYEGLPPQTFLRILKSETKTEGIFAYIPSFTLEEHLYNRFLASQRIEIERVNGRLKRFQILWRYRMRDRFLHRMIFEVVCNVVNIQMELEPMREEIHPILLYCPATRPERSLR
jgi:hypothetical protein